MSNWKTVIDFVSQDENTSLAALRWLQVTELALKHGNDQELGAEIRKLTNK